jgi:hypothetical protein
VAAAAAPGDGQSWPIEGGAAAPPAGHAFAEGLVLDADGDHKNDLVAWSRAPDRLRGEVWFAPGKDPAAGRILAALPGDLAGPGCAPSTTLTRIAASLIVFDFDPRCPRGRERAARWIAVFRLVAGAPPELGLEVRAGAPAEGETLAVAVDGRDRDGDGRGDFTVTLSLSGAPRPLPRGPLPAPGGSAGDGGAPPPLASATLAFLDRPAGLSRDPSEPDASLRVLAARLVADGRRRTTAGRVAGAAGAARRLWSMLCEEGGRPIVTTSAGPVRCGDVHLADDAAMAETEAAINLGDPVAALAAAGRLDAHRKDLDGLLGKSIPSISGRLVRTTAAAPDVQPPPAFGPIAFGARGDIFLRTRDRVVRVDGSTFAESPVDPPPRWPTRLSWPAGDTPSWTLAAVEERCDAPTLVARFSIAGADRVDIPLPILTPSRCTPGARVPVDLLGASSQGALLAVRGDLVAVPLEATPHPALAETLALPPGAAVEPGAARSPNGAVIAVTTARGVLVASLKGAGRSASGRLWTNPTLDGASACVPDDTGERLACAVKDAAAIYDAK